MLDPSPPGRQQEQAAALAFESDQQRTPAAMSE
jgi:hypothetical protein